MKPSTPKRAILVLMDGLRPEPITDGRMPTLTRLAGAKDFRGRNSRDPGLFISSPDLIRIALEAGLRWADSDLPAR